MAETIEYIRFDEDEQRALREAATFVRNLGEDEAKLINSAGSGEPMSPQRVLALGQALYAAMAEQRAHAATVTEHGHENLVPSYVQNIEQVLVPAYEIVNRALEGYRGADEEVPA
jgi:hypothetical protein